MYAVLIVSRPTSQIQRMQGTWPSFLNEAHRHGEVGTDTRPDEAVWVLNLQDHTAIFAGVAAAAMSYQIKTRVLYFEHPPTTFEG